jgi:TetR/AcrR family transcriptional repressor of nem operon
LIGRSRIEDEQPDVKEEFVARPRGFDLKDAGTALLDVFWTKGYEGTAVRELCAATGQRPASLYGAFGDKDQMFRVAMNQYLTWIEGHLTPPEDGRSGVRHVLETTCRLTIEDPSRRGCLIINSVAERENLSPSANATVRESFGRLRALLRRQVEASFASTPPADAEDMVNLLVGATVSIRLLGRSGASADELQSIASGAIAAFDRWATEE